MWQKLQLELFFRLLDQHLSLQWYFFEGWRRKTSVEARRGSISKKWSSHLLKGLYKCFSYCRLPPIRGLYQNIREREREEITVHLSSEKSIEKLFFPSSHMYKVCSGSWCKKHFYWRWWSKKLETLVRFHLLNALHIREHCKLRYMQCCVRSVRERRQPLLPHSVCANHTLSHTQSSFRTQLSYQSPQFFHL